VCACVTHTCERTVKVKAPKKVLSRQEKKKRAKIRAAKIAAGQEVSDEEDEDWE